MVTFQPTQKLVDKPDIIISETTAGLTVAVDKHTLAWLFRETMTKLEVYARRVDEGKDVQAASEFARWVRMSGLVKLFAANPQGEPLAIDAKRVETQIDTILTGCARQWKAGAVGKVELAAIEAISQKLDLIAGHVAKLSPFVAVAHTETASDDALPLPTTFRIVNGGRP